MIRLLAGLASLIVLGACGSSAPSSSADEARCSSAKKLEIEARQFAKGLQDQDPEVKVEDFYRDLARGKVNTSAVGVVDSQQKAHQIVSDNPLCFGVAKVADARRALNIINPAMAEATRLTIGRPD